MGARMGLLSDRRTSVSQTRWQLNPALEQALPPAMALPSLRQTTFPHKSGSTMHKGGANPCWPGPRVSCGTCGVPCWAMVENHWEESERQSLGFQPPRLVVRTKTCFAVGSEF